MSCNDNISAKPMIYDDKTPVTVIDSEKLYYKAAAAAAVAAAAANTVRTAPAAALTTTQRDMSPILPPGILPPLDHYRLQLYNYAMNVERLRCSQYGPNMNAHQQAAGGYPAAAGNPYGPRFSLSMALFPNRIFQPDEPKPQHSYIGLIAMAILSAPDSKLVLSDIYQHILDNYPYFRSRGPGWRNSIRHNLSLNDCFIKAGRSANGKGHYWAVHPANLDDFRKGDFRRRKAQRKVRKHMGLAVDDEGADSLSPPPLSVTPPPPATLANAHHHHHQHSHAAAIGLAAAVVPHGYYTTSSGGGGGAIYSQTRKRQFDVASLLAPDEPSDHHLHHHHHHHHYQLPKRIALAAAAAASELDEDIDVVASDFEEDVDQKPTIAEHQEANTSSSPLSQHETPPPTPAGGGGGVWPGLMQKWPSVEFSTAMESNLLGRYYTQYMAAAAVQQAVKRQQPPLDYPKDYHGHYTQQEPSPSHSSDC